MPPAFNGVNCSARNDSLVVHKAYFTGRNSLHFLQFRYCTSDPSSKPRLEGPGSEFPREAPPWAGPLSFLQAPKATGQRNRSPARRPARVGNGAGAASGWRLVGSRGGGGARGKGQWNCELMFS